MATLADPQGWSNGGSDLAAAGLTLSYLVGQLEEAMMDRLDPVSTGMVRLKIDMAGKGSDTLRIPYVDDVGFSRRFSSLATENAGITASALTTGYSAITLGMHGLSHNVTQRQRILAQPGTALMLNQLIGMVPDSFLSTLRYLGCVAGAAISTNIGSSSTPLGEDEIYALAAAIISASGASDRGMPLVTLHPEQINQMRTSFRSSPAFVQNLNAYLQASGAAAGSRFNNFLGLGFDVQKTEDVVVDTAVYQGFAVAPGGMGFAVASVSGLAADMPRASEPVFVDDYGLIIYRTTSGLDTAINGYQARAHLGVAMGSTTVFFQRGVISAQ